VSEVNRGRRTIILANGMDRIGLAKRPQIFLKYDGANPVGQRVCKFAPAKPEQGAFQKIFGAVLDHRFGKRKWLDQQKPVIKNRSELLRDLPIKQVCRHNIQNDEFRQRLGMIESQAMRDASTSVVPYEREIIKS